MSHSKCQNCTLSDDNNVILCLECKEIITVSKVEKPHFYVFKYGCRNLKNLTYEQKHLLASHIVELKGKYIDPQTIDIYVRAIDFNRYPWEKIPYEVLVRIFSQLFTERLLYLQGLFNIEHNIPFQDLLNKDNEYLAKRLCDYLVSDDGGDIQSSPKLSELCCAFDELPSSTLVLLLQNSRNDLILEWTYSQYKEVVGNLTIEDVKWERLPKFFVTDFLKGMNLSTLSYLTGKYKLKNGVGDKYNMIESLTLELRRITDE